MTEEKIIGGNRLIAEFVGLKTWQNKNTKAVVVWIADNISTSLREWAKWNSSWDWLMPVIEKISRIEYERWEEIEVDGEKVTVIETAYPRTFGMINHKTGNPMVRINRCPVFEGSTLIEAAWLAVVDFITVYNQTHHTHE